MPKASSSAKANIGILSGLTAFFVINYGLQILGTAPLIAGVAGTVGLLVFLFGSAWAIDYWVRGSNCISANVDSDLEHNHKWFFFRPGIEREVQTRTKAIHGVDMYVLSVPLQFEDTHVLYGKVNNIHLVSVNRPFSYLFSADFMVRSNVVIFSQEIEHGHVWVFTLEEIAIPETANFANEPTYLVTYDQSRSLELRQMATEGKLGVEQLAPEIAAQYK